MVKTLKRIIFVGSNCCSWKLIFRPQIEKDHNNTFRFMKKVILDKINKKKNEKKNLDVSIEHHCNDKNTVSQFFQTFLHQIYFLYQTKIYYYGTLLYVG